MATKHYHTWQSGPPPAPGGPLLPGQARDDLWQICGTLLEASGWPDTPTFVAQVWAANPTIGDWHAIPTGTRVLLPYASG